MLILLLLLCFCQRDQNGVQGFNWPSNFGTRSLMHKWRRESSVLPRVSILQMVKTTTDLDSIGNNSSMLRKLHPAWNDSRVRHGSLCVDGVHKLSYRIYFSNDESTASTGAVGLFLHGGPGAGCFPNHVRFFDPSRYRQVVLLDQRGCGKSQPTGCLTDNTLQDLVEDCESLKKHLQLDYWDVVLGGSWGTTIAICYCQQYPTSVSSLILRGVCLLRSQEIDWLFSKSGGAAKLYPERFKLFCQAVGVRADDDGTNNLEALYAYYQKLWAAKDEKERVDAARAWMEWEYFNSVGHKIPSNTNTTDRTAIMEALQTWTIPPCPLVLVNHDGRWMYQSTNGTSLLFDGIPHELPRATDDVRIEAAFRRNISIGYNGMKNEPRDTVPVSPTTPYYSKTAGIVTLPVQAMLTCFYSTNNDWCRNYIDLLDPKRMKVLESVPCICIHGGSDGICPPDSALDLLDAWPNMELRMPIDAGHSMYDALITNELLQATDRMADFVISERKAQV